MFIPAPPNTGLYFTLSGTVYLPGDTTDIGSDNANDRSGPGSSLIFTYVLQNMKGTC